MKVDILMATFTASIESVERISGLPYRGSVQGRKAIVSSTNATGDRSGGPVVFIA